MIGHKDHDVHENAELFGIETKEGSRFLLYSWMKPLGNGSNGAAFSEMEHRERTEAVLELDDRAHQRPHSSEPGNTESHLVIYQTYLAGEPISSMNNPLSASPRGKQEPLPLASDLYLAPQSKEAIAAEEKGFEYQARRLGKGE